VLYEFKHCSKCAQDKPLAEFFKDAKSKDGLQSQCKQCKSAAISAYYQTPEGRLRKAPSQKPSPEALRRKSLKAYYRDPVAANISRRIRKSLGVQGGKANRSWCTLVGYSATALRQHLEEQFDETQTWANYGKTWHVDHIVPLYFFGRLDVMSPLFRLAWSLDNLRPLAKPKNLRKGRELNCPSVLNCPVTLERHSRVIALAATLRSALGAREPDNQSAHILGGSA